MTLFDVFVVFLLAKVVHLGSYPWRSNQKKCWKQRQCTFKGLQQHWANKSYKKLC